MAGRLSPNRGEQVTAQAIDASPYRISCMHNISTSMRATVARRSYLMVLEGCTSVDMNADVHLDIGMIHGHSYGDGGHAMKYLFDDTIVHEICSYLTYALENEEQENGDDNDENDDHHDANAAVDVVDDEL